MGPFSVTVGTATSSSPFTGGRRLDLRLLHGTDVVCFLRSAVKPIQAIPLVQA
jgi:hypothetical protein